VAVGSVDFPQAHSVAQTATANIVNRVCSMCPLAMRRRAAVRASRRAGRFDRS
jgi:hypothetical protein